MTSFDAEKAHQETLKKLDEIISLLETLTVINATSAGMPSTKIREVLGLMQAKVSNITKNITGRASPSDSPGKAKD